MLPHWRSCILGVVLVVGSLMVASALDPKEDINYGSNNNSPTDSQIRLQEVQNRFLDIIGNSTSELHSLTEMMSLVHTDAGKEIGKLLVEGFALGIKQKNSALILSQFWTQLQDRLSPALVDSFDDYKDFLKGMDISTLPLVWDDLFKKDGLGNSLAGLPMGQLVDMVQPTAAKYGIDIKALMNSFMGHGDNNIRDLLLSALNNADFSSLMSQIINTTANAIQTSDTSSNTEDKIQNGDAPKKGKPERTLRLFRPFVASLLKENKIDLDADAVLDVLSPIFRSDIIAQASPWLTMLAGQGDKGGLGSLIASFMGGGQEGFNQQQITGLLGGIGALMAAGGNDHMDMSSIINMASMFIGAPAKKKTNNNKLNKNTKEKANDLDLSSLMNVAGQLIGDNINLDTVLDFASRSLRADDKKKSLPKESTKKVKVAKQEAEKPKTPKMYTKQATKQETSNKNRKTSKNLLDIIEPIMQSMKKDKKCNAKIKDAINFGKALLHSKISSLGDLEQILSLLVSYVGDIDTLTANGVKLETLAKSFTQAIAKADWADFLDSLENKDFRQMLIRKIAPNAADLISLMATKATQGKVYDTIVPRLQNFMASYGLVGITLDNFPERIAPMLGMLGKGWNLPFNPTTVLVPLKVYLKGLKSWALAGLEEVQSLSSTEVEKRVIDALEKDVCESVLKVVQVMRTTPDLQCLPQRLCQVNTGLRSDSLRAAVTRAVSLVAASGPVLATPDSVLLLHTVQAISGITQDCKAIFPGDCSSTEQDDDDSASMDLQYDHQEL